MKEFICFSITQSSLQELNRCTVAAFFFFFFFFETNWRNFFFAKENSLWPFDSWKMITEIFQQPAKKKIINMHDIEMEEKKTLHFIHTLLEFGLLSL